jgi:hypothetical protein
MKHMKLLVCLFPLCLFAQTNAVEPAGAGSPTKEAEEAALRARVKGFYDLQVEGKFRQTESFVCPESQDAYYTRPKRKIVSAEIASIKLGDDLKSASVSALIEDNVSFGGAEKQVKLPTPSQWKRVDEQWCYYIPPASDFADTPFGRMNFNSGKDKATGLMPFGDASKVKPPDVGAAEKLVDFSKRGVRLPFEADGADEIVVTNGLPGPVGFRVVCPNIPGLVCRFDESTLKSGGQTKFHVDFKFRETPIRPGQAVSIWIEPFSKLVSIPIGKLEAPKPQ